MPLTLSSQPAFYDLADDLLSVARPLRTDAIQHISQNAKFAVVRNERIYMGFFRHGDFIPLPVSPADGYHYSQDEVTYRATLVSTRAPEAFSPGQPNRPFEPGQKIFPQISGKQVAQLRYFAKHVDDSTAQVQITVSYFKEGGSETITNDGLVKVYAKCQRNSAINPGGALVPPPAIGAHIPLPTVWRLYASVSGGYIVRFAIPQNADYEALIVTLLVDDEVNRVSSALMADVFAGDTTITIADQTNFMIRDYITVGREVMQIVGPGLPGEQATSPTLEVARAQKLSSVDAPAAGALVARLFERLYTFDFPAGYTSANPTQNPGSVTGLFGGYAVEIRPGSVRAVYASLRFFDNGAASNLLDESLIPNTAELEVWGNLPGLRSTLGGLGTIQIPGPLATGDGLAPPLILPPGVSIQAIYALILSGPVGADVILQLQLDGADFGPVGIIPAQATSGALVASATILYGAVQGDVGGRTLSVNILQVGSGDPGADLTIKVLL